MKRWLLIAAGVACTPSSDGNADSVGMNGTGSTGDPVATSSGSSGSADSTGAADSSSETSAESSGSTGTPGCAPENLPAEITEVEGCSEPVGVSYCAEGRNHVEIGTEIAWMNNPPHSGPHFPTWETWGEHESTVERGYWVHNMEHGGIVLGYLCPDGCEEDLAVLRAVAEQRPEARILITPDPLLVDNRFAAVSWTWVHPFDTADLDELLCFVDQHFNHAPEDVP